MDLLHVVLVLIVIGVLLWLVGRAPFVDSQMKQIINFIVLVAVVLWLLTIFGLLPIAHLRVGSP